VGDIRRREFITLLGGAGVWPGVARAQQPERMRRVGVLLTWAADDVGGQAQQASLVLGLQGRGWVEGRNIRMDFRWGAGAVERYRDLAAELVAQTPDVLVVNGAVAAGALQRATRTIPIVFARVIDPVGAGLVSSLARPGGHTTGFLLNEYGMSAKWLELLKELAPGVTRAAVLRDSGVSTGIAQFAAIQAMASSLAMELTAIDVRDEGGIERALVAFKQQSNGGLIVTSGTLTFTHRELIAALANRHRLPSVYSSRSWVSAGGLMSYGPELSYGYPQAASYVDRILRGEKPGDLPVQAPTKYELVINLKTAKALGLTVPDTLLARADEVIE
jgi:putative ABC transport system substrate-binding protein